MKIYARVVDSIVVEVIELNNRDEDGNFIPVGDCFTPEFVKDLVDVTGNRPAEGFIYNQGVFSPPSASSLISPTNKEDTEIKRLSAYANPVTGSDRYFAEAMSLQAEGFAASSTEVKETKAKGVARKSEIKSLYPYPE